MGKSHNWELGIYQTKINCINDQFCNWWSTLTANPVSIEEFAEAHKQFEYNGIFIVDYSVASAQLSGIPFITETIITLIVAKFQFDAEQI